MGTGTDEGIECCSQERMRLTRRHLQDMGWRQRVWGKESECEGAQTVNICWGSGEKTSEDTGEDQQGC